MAVYAAGISRKISNPLCSPVSTKKKKKFKVSLVCQGLDNLNVEGLSDIPELTLWRSHLSHFYLSVSILSLTRLYGPIPKVKLFPLPDTIFGHFSAVEQVRS